MTTITVEHPSGISLSQTLSAIDCWLDTQGIRPVSLQPVRLAGDKRLGFQLRFRSENEASLFGSEFA
jgi:hypothetical protein